ncbi:hypothetical protein OCS_05996 [Ophiocordyceps sinensis CO18]|uniref:Uncharacterized protein n=1 Tax=Ophiocordyceps sinensis (strain Co18 / CGMCC 3.14243) TaxID=911162 RepID=T5A912_OPHSC|nr:hypothetical protein OCS_05996 [Ophiocordyceps sinensis CO18]
MKLSVTLVAILAGLSTASLQPRQEQSLRVFGRNQEAQALAQRDIRPNKRIPLGKRGLFGESKPKLVGYGRLQDDSLAMFFQDKDGGYHIKSLAGTEWEVDPKTYQVKYKGSTQMIKKMDQETGKVVKKIALEDHRIEPDGTTVVRLSKNKAHDALAFGEKKGKLSEKPFPPEKLPLPKPPKELCRRDGLTCSGGKTALKEKAAGKRFRALAEKTGLKELVTRKTKPVTFGRIGKSLSRAGTASLGYSTKLLGAAGAAVGAGAWVKSVVDVFSQESTTAERVAATTALLPLVGCVTQLVADKERGENKLISGVDAGFCLVADVLLVIPGGQAAGVALHLARALFRMLAKLLAPEAAPDMEKTYFQYK